MSGVMRKEDKHKGAQWRLVVENPDAFDPCEVRYRLCLVATRGGRILARDALITDGETGVFSRIIEAMKKPTLKFRPQKPTPDVYRAEKL